MKSIIDELVVSLLSCLNTAEPKRNDFIQIISIFSKRIHKFKFYHKQMQIEYVFEEIYSKLACTSLQKCSFLDFVFIVVAITTTTTIRRGGGIHDTHLSDMTRLEHVQLVLGTTQFVVDEKRVRTRIQFRALAKVLANLVLMLELIDARLY